MILKFVKFNLLLIILVAIFSCGGFGFTYEKQIDNNIYLIATDVMNQMSLSYKVSGNSYVGMIDETVFEIQYNERFIIAKQHPKNRNDQILKDLTYYYIIDLNKEIKASKKPSQLTKQEFFEQMNKNNISEPLVNVINFRELQ
ncbi:uncharacterized protein DUF3997 [Gramella sp. Hel_I_59]|uniref:DUF3997 domain-containing protein n=1 Tax=Gramella sp. Hel_I_59 TaxID=1249978 RepID=UPI001153B2EA|nr:DUF3997 domain-containing protein [Gramella sp. Hel_I_59]TQI71150.1 uncharacterized protein DUF3997 [Gramella sp. Hel_I_59]